ADIQRIEESSEGIVGGQVDADRTANDRLQVPDQLGTGLLVSLQSPVEKVVQGEVMGHGETSWGKWLPAAEAGIPPFLNDCSDGARKKQRFSGNARAVAFPFSGLEEGGVWGSACRPRGNTAHMRMR